MAEKMKMNDDQSKYRRVLNVLVLAGFLSFGAGCSAVPDYANPVEWYKGTVDWLSGDDEDEVQGAKTAPQPVAKAEKPVRFPKLNTVPDRPQPPSETEQKKLASGLAADRASARYTDEQVRAGNDVSPSSSSSQNVASSPGSVTPEVINSPRTPVPPPQPAAPQRVTAPQAPEQRGFGQPPAPPAKSTFQTPPPTRSAAVPPPTRSAAVPPPERVRPVQAGSSLPPNMVPASQDGSVFVQADRFSPRFPATSRQIARVRSGEFATANVAPPAAVPTGRPVATIYFGNGSSKLDSKARARIRQAVALYKSSPGGQIQVTGHASSRTRNLDPARHHLANFRVSHARAIAVAQELIRLGIPSGNISVAAMADQKPAFVEVMPAGESGNRRAEIFFAR